MGRTATFWLAPALLLSTLLASWAASPAYAEESVLQPGDRVDTPVGQCTLNFVFRGPAGQTLIGTAGHCGEPGQSASSPLFPNFGTFVYDDDQETDFALIQVKDQFVGRVSPAVLGHPQFPTGFTRNVDTTVANVLRFSGYGVGFASTPTTRQQRVGLLVTDSPTFYCADAPIIFGDSGGPVLHDASKKALGIVSAIAVDCSVVGATVQGAMAEAAQRGFPITLRTI